MNTRLVPYQKPRKFRLSAVATTIPLPAGSATTAAVPASAAAFSSDE